LVWRWWLAEVNDVECSVIILWFEGSWAVHDVVDDWTRWRMKLCFSFLLCFCLCFSPFILFMKLPIFIGIKAPLEIFFKQVVGYFPTCWNNIFLL
jgi:hypothetical protein